MKVFAVAFLFAILITYSAGFYIQNEATLYDNLHDLYQVDENSYLQAVRRPRSPDGEFDLKATHVQQQGGHARAEYNHRLWQNGKAHLDANAYYSRNWGNTPGARKDYGGGLQLSVPLGRH